MFFVYSYEYLKNTLVIVGQNAGADPEILKGDGYYFYLMLNLQGKD